MKAVFVLLLVALASATMESKFRSWMNEFGKEYSSENEYYYRFGIFSAKYEEIERFNAEEHSWKKGLNQFSDLTTEEFAEEFLMEPHSPEVVGAGGSDITQNIDWKAKGAVTEVKNQHQCGNKLSNLDILTFLGSCWAFGTVESIEGCYEIAGNTLTSLSEQQLVDCVSGAKYDCNGCDGGYPNLAMQWLIDNDVGLETEANYPYTSLKNAGTCA